MRRSTPAAWVAATEAAKDFYDHALAMQHDMGKQMGQPPTVNLTGIGEAAYGSKSGMKASPEPIFLVGFKRGRVFAQVRAWKEGASAEEVARAAARQVAAKLP